jgi:hypothetical protein
MWCMLQVKLSLVAALRAWLQRVQKLPEAVLAHFRGGVKEKEALRRAHLRCLVQVSAPMLCATWFILAYDHWHCCDVMSFDCQGNVRRSC